MTDHVIVEIIPEYLRANPEWTPCSTYPHNGARRLVICREEAELLVEGQPQWARIVEDASPPRYPDSLGETGDLHECGGQICSSSAFGEPYHYCWRCGAYGPAGWIPSGTDPAANQAAWRNGNRTSPEMDDEQ